MLNLGMTAARHPYRNRMENAGNRGMRLSDQRDSAPRETSPLVQHTGLAAILVIAALLRGWNLDRGGGVIVPYYFAGVRSMLQSWHNLFFNAFDPAGFVSVDKPPLAFWLQTLCAKAFGFGPASVLLPQMIEGVAAVVLLYWLVRRSFGVAAGLLAALFLALSPIDVAVDRSNNTESCLVLVLLLAAWALIRALETQKLWPLLLSALLVGLGFNVKMLVAFGVVPAFAMAYLFGVTTPWARRVAYLCGAAVVLAMVSLSWPLAYDLTPAADRPYVDSTADNSMLELVVGHNFAQRFVRPAGSRRETAARASATPDTTTVVQGRDYAPAGPLRLAAPSLAAQIGWLFPLALIGGLAAWRRYRYATEGQAWQLAMWGGWALAYGAVFSAAGGLFHAYYLVVIAPALSALAGVGGVALYGGSTGNAVSPHSGCRWRSSSLRCGKCTSSKVISAALWRSAISGFPWRCSAPPDWAVPCSSGGEARAFPPPGLPSPLSWRCRPRGRSARRRCAALPVFLRRSRRS